MRLIKFLTLSVALSRNQAKFFIKRGRVSVNGKTKTDPDFELLDSSLVLFDGKPISIIEHQYIVLHKPPSYECAPTNKQNKSILDLIKNRSEKRSYHFANILAPELTGIVLLSNDIRWVSRMKLRLQKKTWIYRIRLRNNANEVILQQLKSALSENEITPTIAIDDEDKRSILLHLSQTQGTEIVTTLASLNLKVATLQLKQLGRLNLGELKEGDYLELMENEVKI
jgi:16S rRNA pseudouridine516 synthase